MHKHKITIFICFFVGGMSVAYTVIPLNFGHTLK